MKHGLTRALAALSILALTSALAAGCVVESRRAHGRTVYVRSNGRGHAHHDNGLHRGHAQGHGHGGGHGGGRGGGHGNGHHAHH